MWIVEGCWGLVDSSLVGHYEAAFSGGLKPSYRLFVELVSIAAGRISVIESARYDDYMKTAKPKALVTVYSKPGCHLCEEAKANIESAGCDGEFTLEEVNIDDDPALLERYRYDIPIVLINGVKVFKHHVDPGEFRRKLRRLGRTEGPG